VFVNKSGVECGNLEKTTSGEASAESCLEACCAQPFCNVWQWKDPSAKVGTTADPCVPAHACWCSVDSVDGREGQQRFLCLFQPPFLTLRLLDVALQGGGCWAGNCATSFRPSDSWVGGVRKNPVPPPPGPPPTPPSPVPGPAPPSPVVTTGPLSKGFDDSAWNLVDVPHDFIISGVYDQNQSGSGHSYLPRKNAYYRLV
jgi:hypothetical protein